MTGAPAAGQTDAASSAFVALGANLGDRMSALTGAVAALKAAPGVVVEAVSSLYETEAVGGPDGQGAFLNGAVRVATSLPPTELLELLLDIERRHDRVREVRWGPRTLDLDILFYADEAFETPRLTVPHPRLHERRFVLAPLADVGADVRHPLLKRTVAELLADLPKDDLDDVVRVAETWV